MPEQTICVLIQTDTSEETAQRLARELEWWADYWARRWIETSGGSWRTPVSSIRKEQVHRVLARVEDVKKALCQRQSRKRNR